jgi:hypothetical protein
VGGLGIHTLSFNVWILPPRLPMHKQNPHIVLQCVDGNVWILWCSSYEYYTGNVHRCDYRGRPLDTHSTLAESTDRLLICGFLGGGVGCGVPVHNSLLKLWILGWAAHDRSRVTAIVDPSRRYCSLAEEKCGFGMLYSTGPTKDGNSSVVLG